MKKYAFLGPQCTGKTTCTELVKHYIDGTAVNLKFADPLYSILEVLNMQKNRRFMQELSDLIKAYMGPKYFVRVFRREVDELEGWVDILTNDDCRFQMEFDYLTQAGWHTIYIDTDKDIRRERAVMNGLEFLPNHPSETQVLKLKDACDIVITNNGTLLDFKDAVLTTIRELENGRNN